MLCLILSLSLISQPPAGLNGLEKSIIVAKAETLADSYRNSDNISRRKLVIDGLANEIRTLNPGISSDEAQQFLSYTSDVACEPYDTSPAVTSYIEQQGSAIIQQEQPKTNESAWYIVDYNGKDVKVWGIKRDDGLVEWSFEEQPGYRSKKTVEPSRIIKDDVIKKDWYDTEINGVRTKVWGYRAETGKIRIVTAEQPEEIKRLITASFNPPVPISNPIPQEYVQAPTQYTQAAPQQYMMQGQFNSFGSSSSAGMDCSSGVCVPRS